MSKFRYKRYGDPLRGGRIMAEMYLRAIPMTNEQLVEAIAEAQREYDALPTGFRSKKFLWWRVNDVAKCLANEDAHSRVFYLKKALSDKLQGQQVRARAVANGQDPDAATQQLLAAHGLRGGAS